LTTYNLRLFIAKQEYFTLWDPS